MITLTLRAPLDAHLDMEGVTPDRCAILGEGEIARLTVTLGGRAAALGDLFSVRGGHAPHLRIEGDLSSAVRVGAAMTSGELEVDGNVGDDAGLAMGGGILRISGNAGARLGAAAPGASRGMTGGEIVIAGSAGPEAAARARRGLVVVGGDAGDYAARAIIAGTLIVLGRTGAEPGRGSKRGTVIGVGRIDPPATYRLACTYEPPHVRLTMTYLRRRYALPIEDVTAFGRYRRYCGDADPRKGEILEYATESGL